MKREENSCYTLLVCEMTYTFEVYEVYSVFFSVLPVVDHA